MFASQLNRRWIVLGFVLAVSVLSAGVWRYGYVQALDQLAQRARVDLALASDRLSTQLQVYQELAVLMADHPSLADLNTAEERAAARALFLEVADKTAALDVMYADASGRVLAAAMAREGDNLSQTSYFRRAMQGALGRDHGLTELANLRAYFFAAPVFRANGEVRGAVIVVADVEDVEWTWRGSTPAVFFTDDRGEVFISNRSELLFWQQMPDGQGLRPAQGAPRDFSAKHVGGHDIWRVAWGGYIPARALHLALELPVIGLTGEVLADVAPARRLAMLQAAALAAICLAFGALLYLAMERRRTLAEANAILETRVQQRTRALSDTNMQLRREVVERQEAEAALKKAQADLVQAGKLSALGQMSAGISHELNQPLMAIQSFADNGTQYLERGRTEVAAENLGRISDLTRRMGRIIKNLRAFARQESEPSSRVDVVEVLNSAMELAGPRLRAEQVELIFDTPPHPVWVRGGEVRLGQVFLNLVTNALDAMADVDRKLLRVAVRDDAELMVTFHDSGPGIDDPGKVFDPFYSTKAVGAAEGMGLGLSISYGLVQSFGGEIRGQNAPEGGALFTVELERWVEEKVA